MSLTIDGVALVIGAGSGIGRDCAIAYAAEGASAVVFTDLNLQATELASKESLTFATNPKYKTLALQIDVTDATSVEAVVNHTIQEFGRIDYCVNSAGVGVQTPAEISDAVISEYERFWEVNIKGVVNCTTSVARAMKKQTPRSAQGRLGPRVLGRGVIVNIGSCNSYVATKGMAQYTMSKHAVLGLTRNAALDCAPYGIRINSVCPSWVDTPMVRAALDANAELRDLIDRAVPMKRIASTEEVSDIVMFLSSPKASYVTGAGWIVDGGTTLQLQT